MGESSEVVWDLPTRIIHWALAICITLNLFILEEGDLPHQISGYTAVSLVLLRSLWGFKGSYHSRFKNFQLHPRFVWGHLKDEFSGHRGPPHLGHNPLASWTYVFMWLLILCLGVSGWMMDLDAFWGEEWLEDLHETFANGVLALVVVHFLGIAWDSIKYRRGTWKSMWTGRKRSQSR